MDFLLSLSLVFFFFLIYNSWPWALLIPSLIPYKGGADFTSVLTLHMKRTHEGISWTLQIVNTFKVLQHSVDLGWRQGGPGRGGGISKIRGGV